MLSFSYGQRRVGGSAREGGREEEEKMGEGGFEIVFFIIILRDCYKWACYFEPKWL